MDYLFIFDTGTEKFFWLIANISMLVKHMAVERKHPVPVPLREDQAFSNKICGTVRRSADQQTGVLAQQEHL
jgi:hypothetical protein